MGYKKSVQSVVRCKQNYTVSVGDYSGTAAYIAVGGFNPNDVVLANSSDCGMSMSGRNRR